MRSFLWKLVKGFLFRLDAERAHRLTVRMIRFTARLGSGTLRIVSGASAPSENSTSPVVFGMRFLSPVGLAAGFDKDAEILTALPQLGFGFAEIGTVTPRPQPGNEKPRLFRDIERRAVFNRMGFNSAGAEVVSARLAKMRGFLPPDFRVGVNVGKNKDTSLEQAADDYVLATRSFEGLADYLVINVSSPNTPGLRSLQTIEALKPIVQGVDQMITGWKRRPPLLLKLAPEIQGAPLAELIHAVESWGIDGWVLTNTLAGTIEAPNGTLAGGWSGSVLTEKSRESLEQARKATKLPIISVGGIMGPEDALKRFESGASLVQVYSGWIFGGPAFPAIITRKLANSKS